MYLRVRVYGTIVAEFENSMGALNSAIFLNESIRFGSSVTKKGNYLERLCCEKCTEEQNREKYFFQMILKSKT